MKNLDMKITKRLLGVDNKINTKESKCLYLLQKQMTGFYIDILTFIPFDLVPTNEMLTEGLVEITLRYENGQEKEVPFIHLKAAFDQAGISFLDFKQII